MGKTTGKGWALLGLIICFLCNLAYVSPVQAAEIIRETIPLERNNVRLHLERYVEQDGQTKKTNLVCAWLDLFLS
jgi:hypothetical protein